MNNHLPSADLVIRPAIFTDIPLIQDIAVRTWPVAYGKILGDQQLQYMLHKFYSTQALDEQMRDKHYFFIALKEYSPIGFASFSKIENNIYKLQKLYVLPGTQKSGIGKALLQTVETVAKSMGGKKLQLNVNRKNVAKSFYERNEFSVIKQEDIDIGSGFFMNDYILEKDL
jgi:ribosomal protein S18 acetylase RimI-like enzyme